MKIGIICAPGLEECEALIAYDMLYRAKLDVKLIGLEKEIVSSHQVKLIPHMTIDEFDYQNYDCLVLPGGIPGTPNLEANNKVQTIIDYFVKENKYIAAICAAPSILIHKGLIEEGKFICHPGHECGLKVTENVKAYTNGKIITSKGFGTGFQFGYEIIKNLIDENTAEEILQKIQYY